MWRLSSPLDFDENKDSAMSESSSVTTEIADHKEDLTGWVKAVSDKTVPDSMTGVVSRFSRDCQTLMDDMTKADSHTTRDLNDFVDRRNSLETQYLSIQQHLG
jgi:hypothetical protein